MKLLLRFLTIPLIFLLAVSALAQQPTPTLADQALQRYRDSQAAMLLDDFGELARYRDANSALKPPAPGENRVVFFGDSITEGWHLDEYFPGKPYINRGISGQTTPQMLIRFRQDVLDLQPKVVIILAGTNDIAGNTGPMRPEDTGGKLRVLRRFRPRQQRPCRVFVGTAPPQLHSAIAELLPQPPARKNPGVEPLAEGLRRCPPRLPLSRLLYRRG